eukprot:PhF_6_TR41056/c0_g1_i3/m.62186
MTTTPSSTLISSQLKQLSKLRHLPLTPYGVFVSTHQYIPMKKTTHHGMYRDAHRPSLTDLETLWSKLDNDRKMDYTTQARLNQQLVQSWTMKDVVPRTPEMIPVVTKTPHTEPKCETQIHHHVRKDEPNNLNAPLVLRDRFLERASFGVLWGLLCPMAFILMYSLRTT